MKKKMKRQRVMSSHRAIEELESLKKLTIPPEDTVNKAPSMHDAECSPIIFDDSEESESEKKEEEGEKGDTPFRTNNNSIQ